MNVVLAAEESAGLQMLRSLVHSKHNLVGVLAEVPKLGAAGGASGMLRGNLAVKPGRRSWCRIRTWQSGCVPRRLIFC